MRHREHGLFVHPDTCDIAVVDLQPPALAPTAPRDGLRSWVITISFWSYMLISNPVLWLGAVLVFVLTFPFDRRRRVLHLYTCAWAYHYVLVNPLWKPRFEGRQHVERGRTYVLVANHQSLGDILLLFGLFRHFKWVSKREIFRVPFVGWNMRMNDYVALLRGDAASIEQMMQACRRHLKAGSSVMLFPEGTRSEDGQIKAFKRGAFTLAKELELPIIPIVIDGTHHALPKKGLMLRQKRALSLRVHVLEAIEPGAAGSVQELSDLVRERMIEELARMRSA